MAVLTITPNKDGTVTVRYGRIISHVDIRGLTLAQAIEHVRWAAIGSGIPISEEAAWAALRQDD